MDEQFRILLVCTGNVCRSPLAERIIRARLASALGDRARAFVVTSAGTESRPGLGMDPRAARAARILGADVEGFRSREMTSADVAAADLVLTACRTHRARAVRLHPLAHRYAFTIREFARLTRSLSTVPSAVPAGTPARVPAGGTRGADGADDAVGPDQGDEAVRRARRLVAGAAALRGTVRPRRPEDDDVTDPAGGAGQVHRSVASVIADALAGPLEIITGVDCSSPGRRLPRRKTSTVSGHPGPTGPTSTAEPVGEAAAEEGKPRRSGRAGRRWLVRMAVGVILAALLGAGWLAVRAVQAERELGLARTGMSTLRGQLLAGNRDSARRTLVGIARHTRRAHRLTSGPTWRIAAVPPYFGNTARAVRAAASATDTLSHRVLPSVIDLSASLDPAVLRPRGDTVAVDRLRAIAPVAHAAATALASVRVGVDRVDRSWLVPPVASGLAGLRAELDSASSILDSMDQAARLVPAMLGADGPRHYLVAFQNNAEARGTGGLVGLYAVISADHGRLRVDQLGSNTALRSASKLPVDLGPDFRARWGDNPAMWSNSNMDPNFPYAAKLWLTLWASQTHQHLDGVIATDPVALGYVLRATGPVRLSSGDSVSDDNAAALTMSEVYARFPDDNTQRDAYMRDVAHRIMDTLLSGRGNVRTLLGGLSRAASERRLLVYSTHGAEEHQLVDTPLGGTLPSGDGAYAFVVVNNAAGSKMDYYLTRSLTYTSDRCTDGVRRSRIEITFGNSAPAASELPRYVIQRQDSDQATLTQSPATDSVSVLVSVYGPRNSTVRQATLDGHALGMSTTTEDGRPVWGFPLVVGHATSRTVALQIAEPPSNATPVVPVQPLVQPEKVHTSLVRCR